MPILIKHLPNKYIQRYSPDNDPQGLFFFTPEFFNHFEGLTFDLADLTDIYSEISKVLYEQNTITAEAEIDPGDYT